MRPWLGALRGRPVDTWFLAMLAVALLSATAIHGVRPMTTYRALGLGAGPFEIGLIASSFSVLGLVAALPLGRWVDRIGEAPFVVAGMLLIGGSSAIGAWTDSLLILAVSQAFMGLGHILSLLALQAMVANRGGREGRDARFGYWTAAVSVGQLVGPATAGFLVSQSVSTIVPGSPADPSNREVPAFVFGALAAGISAVIALRFVRGGEPRRAKSDPGAAPAGSMLTVATRILRRPGMGSAMLVSVIVISTVDVLIAYLPAFGEEKGLTIGFVAALLSLRAAASLVSRLFMGRLIGKLGRRALLTSCLAMGAVGMVVSALLPLPGLLVVCMILVGFGLGVGQPMTIAWVADRSPRSERATAIGVRLMGNRVALLAAPATMGAIAGAGGVTAIFWVLAGSIALGAWIAWMARLVTDSNDEPEVARIE